MYESPRPTITPDGEAEAYIREVFVRAALRFVGNDAESYGMPFEFDDWQLEHVWYPIFGAGHLEGEEFVRDYRRALIGVPRGVGKTVIACAMLLAEATVNVVYNGQYGLVADSEPNAKNAYKVLCDMIRISPELSKTWHVYKGRIENIETGQWIRTFPNKVSALQGWHFNFCICDEVHVYRDDAVWQAVISGQGRVKNALAVAITTAGDERRGFLWDWFEDIQAGGDPGCWCYWVGIDDGDDPEDRSCWRKVLITPRITMEQLEDQRRGLGKRRFERYQLNHFPMEQSEDPFISQEDIDQCQETGPIDRDRWFSVGVDGAARGDTLAVVACQRDDEGNPCFEEWCWERPGTMGVYDLTDVADVLTELMRENGAPIIYIDPARLGFLSNWLYNERGIELFAMGQTPKLMCPASEALAREVELHNARLGGCPTLSEHLANCVADERAAYGRRFSSRRHGKGSKRIDAAVAAAMAMSAYDANVSEQVSSWAVATVRFA